jgi:hypothetical protein
LKSGGDGRGNRHKNLELGRQRTKTAPGNVGKHWEGGCIVVLWSLKARVEEAGHPMAHCDHGDILHVGPSFNVLHRYSLQETEGTTLKKYS